jgi:hypothetical protein
VRPSHILVRTALSIYSFYLLRCTYSFYCRNSKYSSHPHRIRSMALRQRQIRPTPALRCHSCLSLLRPTSHSHTDNLHQLSTTASPQIIIMPVPHFSTFYTHAATSSRTPARRNHSSCSCCSFYLGHGWFAQHTQPQPQIHPDLSYLNFFDSLSLCRRSKAAEQDGAHGHEDSPSERVHSANTVRSR